MSTMVQRRNTRQRQLVMDVVRELHDHPTADEVYLKAREVDARISRGTVYRNLALLSEEGDLLSVRIGGANHYDHNTGPHAHAVCASCGRVVDVPLDAATAQTLAKSAATLTGYEISACDLTFSGLCPDCQQSRQDAVSA